MGSFLTAVAAAKEIAAVSLLHIVFQPWVTEPCKAQISGVAVSPKQRLSGEDTPRQIYKRTTLPLHPHPRNTHKCNLINKD